jgi:O-antigen ligase
MDHVRAVMDRKRFTEAASAKLPALFIFALVLCMGGSLAVVGLSSGLKTVGTIVGLVLCIVLAFASGNPRLYCLWAFSATLPLSLSKRFGPMFIGKPGGEDSFRIEVNDVFLFVLLGFLLWELFTRRREGLRIPKVTFLWLLLTGIGCLWVVFGHWRMTAAHEVFRMLKVTLLFVVLTNELNRPRRIWHCVAGLSLAAFVQSVVALIQYKRKGLIGLKLLGETSANTIDVLGKTSVQGEQVFRPSGLLEHANLLGVFLAVVIPIAVGMLLISKRTIDRVALLIVIGVAIPAEIVAMSRSAWVSATIALSLLFFFMFLHRGLRVRAIIATCVGGLLGLLVLFSFIGPISERLLNSKDDATRAREIYKADARRMIDAAPWFGHGLNSYVFELPNYATLDMKSYGDQPPAVHNIFYLWWADTGIFGLILFCTVWASILLTGLTNLTVRDDLLYVVNAACLAGMIALIPDSFLSFTLRVNTTLRLFWLLAALIMAVRYRRLAERSQGRMLRSERAGEAKSESLAAC